MTSLTCYVAVVLSGRGWSDLSDMLRCCSTVRAGCSDLSDMLRCCSTVRAGCSDLSDMLRCCSTVRAGRVTSLTCYVAVL